MTSEHDRWKADHGKAPAGATVITSDGERIGHIKETRGRYFKVAASMQPDYWLRLDTIATSDSGGVRLTVPSGRIAAYQVGEPDEVDADDGRIAEYRAAGIGTDPTMDRETHLMSETSEAGARSGAPSRVDMNSFPTGLDAQSASDFPDTITNTGAASFPGTAADSNGIDRSVENSGMHIEPEPDVDLPDVNAGLGRTGGNRGDMRMDRDIDPGARGGSITREP